MTCVHNVPQISPHTASKRATVAAQLQKGQDVGAVPRSGQGVWPARPSLSAPLSVSPPRAWGLRLQLGLLPRQRPICNRQALQVLNDTSYQQLLNEGGFAREGSSVSLLRSLPSLLGNWAGPKEEAV